MNYKRSLIGMVLFGALTVCVGQEKRDQVSIRNNHDEPVIIENGSVKIDLNLGNGSKAIGFLSEDGRSFIRGNAPSVKRVEVYTAAKAGTLALVMCKDSNSAPIPCKENKINPKTLTAYMTGGGTLQFHWSKGGKDGLIMISPTQVFLQPNASYEFQLLASADAQQNLISLEKIEFMMDGVKQEFPRPADGRLVALLCPNPADDHCALPKK
jgi:hypothetical protein